MECHNSNGQAGRTRLRSSSTSAACKSSDQATIYFEIAPDPDNKLLAARWEGLPCEIKHEVTGRVALTIVPPALAALDVEGELVEQTGGYHGETNPALVV